MLHVVIITVCVPLVCLLVGVIRKSHTLSYDCGVCMM